MTSAEVMRRTGITHRQLLYWWRCRYITPMCGGGSGNHALWDESVIPVITRLARVARVSTLNRSLLEAADELDAVIRECGGQP